MTTTPDDQLNELYGIPAADDSVAKRLRQIPDLWADPPSEWIAKLPRITCRDCSRSQSRVCAEHTKQQCDACGNYITTRHIHLDYVGHADVTLALIAVDPGWSLDLGWDSTAGPIDPFAMGPTKLLARMTVLGVERPCVGTIEDHKAQSESALKELLGDAIRNGAMRFGIATGLWSRSQREGHDPDEAQEPRQRRQQRQAEQPPWTVAMMKAKAVELAEGDTALAAEAYELAVGMVDGDTTFPQERVSQLVNDMEQWLSSRLGGRFHGSEVHGGDDTPSGES